MRKLFSLVIVFLILFFLMSCNTTDVQAKISELEAKITEMEKEDEQLKAETEQKPEAAEEESPAEETSEEKPEKEFSPTISGSLYISGHTTTVYVIGDYAYSTSQGLNVIDITDKNNPTIAGTSSAAGWAIAFYVEGDYAYLPYGNWDNEGNFSEGGFQIIDITDKKKPAVVGTFEFEGGINSICATGNYVYAAYEIIEKQDEGHYSTVESGIKIIDATDKENPISVGIYDTGKSGVSSIHVEGDYAYIFTAGNLKILDITDKENPIDKGSYSSSGWAMDFYIAGDYAYLPSGNSLEIVDITDKDNPIITGGVFSSGDITDVFVEGDYAYIAYVVRDENHQTKESGMQIINIIDKKNPAVVTVVEIPGEAMGIFVSGDYAYVGAGPVGLHILKLYAD